MVSVGPLVVLRIDRNISLFAGGAHLGVCNFNILSICPTLPNTSSHFPSSGIWSTWLSTTGSCIWTPCTPPTIHSSHPTSGDRRI